MDASEYKTIVMHIYDEIFGTGNFEVADEIFAGDFVDHISSVLPGQPVNGPQAVKWYAKMMRDAFPDLQATVESVLVDGDQVAVRVIWRGIHQHQLVFLAPTGRHVTVTGIDMFRLADGKIVEHWGGWNLASLMQQLGMWPTPEGTQM